MKDAVDDDTMKLVIIGLVEFLGIAAHGVKGDDDVAIKDISLIVVEGDDICLVVMTKILLVDLQDFLVADEHVTYLSDLTAMGGCHSLNPCGGIAVTDFRHLYAVCIICNHNLLGLLIFILFIFRDCFTSFLTLRQHPRGILVEKVQLTVGC